MDEEMKKMLNQMCELENQVLQLKEELKTEKLKAKDEAEDLTQEMAELRYLMTNMLKEEFQHQASIEQTSLRRIQELEEQVQREQDKYLADVRHLRKVSKIAEMQAVEVRHLRKALEGFRKITDPETARQIESCDCGSCSISGNLYCSSIQDKIGAEAPDDCDNCNDDTECRGLIGWYPDGRSVQYRRKKKEAENYCTDKTNTKGGNLNDHGCMQAGRWNAGCYSLASN